MAQKNQLNCANKTNIVLTLQKIFNSYNIL